MKDTTRNTYLAVDFGGGSGRVIAGSLLQGKLELEEIHRFTNRQVKLGNHVYWDFPALFEDMKTGLKLAVQKGYHVKGIGIDTWGVDFGLIDKKEIYWATLSAIGMPEQTECRTRYFKYWMHKSITPAQAYK